MGADPVAPRDGADAFTDASADIVVYTDAWTRDHQTRPGEDANAQIHSRVFVNGNELPWCNGISVESRGDFLQARLDVIVRSIRFVPLKQGERPEDVR